MGDEMKNFDRFAELWTDYLEGDLNEQDYAELDALIAANPDALRQAMAHYQIHRAIGLVAQDDSDAFLKATLRRIPLQSDAFVAQVVTRIDSQLHATCTNSELKSNLVPSRGRWVNRRWIPAALLIAASILVALFNFSFRFQNDPSNENSHRESRVKFVNTARTKFLGSFTPAINSLVEIHREYILTSGSVQLLFPTGAETIVEGPAVFQVEGPNHLQVSIGRCSVYCPPGAEGFVVDTPSAKVVDRGTRFFVNVVETSETEVHVVEGVADVYHPSVQSPLQTSPRNQEETATRSVRLTKHQARTFGSDLSSVPQPTDFRSLHFQSRLPDRIIAYQATQEDGGAKDLTSVQVQRNGEVYNYTADQLIGVRLVGFKIAEKIVDMRHLAGNPVLPIHREELLSDYSLNTGAINPGGSVEPCNRDPILFSPQLDHEITTPGFAIEFVRPVKNSPGPDLIFFELQNLTGAPEGDSFHVMPMKFLGNRKAATIKSYDLTLTSPEIQRPANFYLHEFDRSVDSLDELLNADCRALPKPQGSAGYRVLAVAIDLSAMGFEDGENVDGLFFQDSLDDQNHVDPVAIFGLPD